MYARNYDTEKDNLSFQRGGYNIPANYRGNAFIADEPPLTDAGIRHPEPTQDTYVPEKQDNAQNKCSVEPPLCCDECKGSENTNDDRKTGLLSLLGRELEADDLLLLGLIFLFVRGGKDGMKDEILLLIAILFISGF